MKLDNRSFQLKHVAYRETRSSGMLHSVSWYVFIEFSVQLPVPSLMIFLDFLLREDRIDRLPRKVSKNYHSSLSNITEEWSHSHRGESLKLRTKRFVNTPGWPRRKSVAEFQLCVGPDCLGTHLHRIGIRPDTFCMLCSLREPMDRNHLGKCAALANGAECGRYWEARTKMMENWLYSLLITITTLMITPYYWDSYIGIECFYWSLRSMINNQRTCHYKLKKKRFRKINIYLTISMCLCFRVITFASFHIDFHATSL
jgi:hypothetical protein